MELVEIMRTSAPLEVNDTSFHVYYGLLNAIGAYNNPFAPLKIVS